MTASDNAAKGSELFGSVTLGSHVMADAKAASAHTLVQPTDTLNDNERMIKIAAGHVLSSSHKLLYFICTANP